MKWRTKGAATIYLDSSDYSHLTREDHRNELATLVDMKNLGKVVFRYSVVTVSELIHTKAEHKEYGKNRAEVLRSLCGNHALLHYSDVLFQDCIHHFKKSDLDFPTYAYSDEGIYYPQGSVEFKNVKADVAREAQELVEKEIEAIADPIKRRECKFKLKKMFRNGNITADAFGLIKGFDTAMATKYPAPNAIELASLFKRYFENKMSHGAFSREFSKQIFDPFNLATCPPEQSQLVIDTCQWLRKSAPKASEMLEKMREIFLAYESNVRAKNKSLKRKAIVEQFGTDLSRYREKRISGCWKDRAADFRRLGITFKEFSKLHEVEEGAIPSVDISQKVIECYLQQMMLNDTRPFKSSDIGDLIHSTYIPYVDVFRADTTMSNFYKPIAEKYGTAVVPTLAKLIDILES